MRLTKYTAWQLYFHYFILAAVLTVFVYWMMVPDMAGFMSSILSTGMIKLFFGLLIVVAVVDTMLHEGLGMLTGWKD
jgi:hypothetical protein